jgi:hypothetical protein
MAKKKKDKKAKKVANVPVTAQPTKFEKPPEHADMAEKPLPMSNRKMDGQSRTTSAVRREKALQRSYAKGRKSQFGAGV